MSNRYYPGRPRLAGSHSLWRSTSPWRNALDPDAGSRPHDDENDLGSLERLGDSFSFGTVLLKIVRDWGWNVQAYMLFAGKGWRAEATHPLLGRVDVLADSFTAVAGAVFCRACERHHAAARVAA